MSKKDQAEQKNWKSEQQREERNARLAGLTDKSGGKKPLKLHRTWPRVVAIILAIVLVLGASGWAVIRFGVPQRHLTAAKFDDVRISPLEINVYAASLVQENMQVPLFSADGKTFFTEKWTYNDAYETNKDYIVDVVTKQIKLEHLMEKLAKADNFELPEKYAKVLDDSLANFRNSAQMAQINVNDYLVTLFGPGANEQAIREIWSRSFLAQAYQEKVHNDYTYTAEQIETVYQENKDTLDVVSYRAYTVPLETAPADATDEQKAKLLADSKALGEELLAQVTDGPSLDRIALEQAKTDADKEAYAKENATLSEHVMMSNLTYQPQLLDWLKDPARKPGDKALLDRTTSYQIVYLESRGKDERPGTYDVRHILISAVEGQATEEEDAAAKAKAEEILKTYQDGAKTEAHFGELAVQHSADSNAAEGGIYENVSLGKMVAPFEAWAIDPARKPGDAGIVKTQFGYHIMYFIKWGEHQAWHNSARTILQDKDFTAWQTGVGDSATLTLESLGLYFVGPSWVSGH